MANIAMWYSTVLPKDLIKSFEQDLPVLDQQLQPSVTRNSNVSKDIRNSKNCWITTNHWVSGLIWHHVMRANRENFMYDLYGFDSEVLQYTSYGEGEYYRWHSDDSLPNLMVPLQCRSTVFSKENAEHLSLMQAQCVRKLSFSLLLSDPSEFSGGDLQFNNIGQYAESFYAPREMGQVVIFDSRTPHRVTKIKSGVRKSLVGWVVGPRWR